LGSVLIKNEAGGGCLRTGRLQLGWEGGSARRISVLHQQAPLRALFPLEVDGADAVVVNTGGGVVGGDRLRVEIGLGADTEAFVTSQAAEKVYRSAGPTARIHTRLRLGPGATLTWLPQETILFDGSRVDRRLEVEMDPDARLLAAEMLVFGRLARGEHLQDSHLRESWDVRVGDRLAWAERFGFSPPDADVLDEPALGGGARALATAVFAAAQAPAALEAARAAMDLAGDSRGGVTAVNGLLVARILGSDPAAVRRSLARSVAAWRGVLLGQSPSLPRLWSI
jgi:urease accessory protein